MRTAFYLIVYNHNNLNRESLMKFIDGLKSEILINQK